jgi:hypothetical protein
VVFMTHLLMIWSAQQLATAEPEFWPYDMHPTEIWKKYNWTLVQENKTPTSLLGYWSPAFSTERKHMVVAGISGSSHGKLTHSINMPWSWNWQRAAPFNSTQSPAQHGCGTLNISPLATSHQL